MDRYVVTFSYGVTVEVPAGTHRGDIVERARKILWAEDHHDLVNDLLDGPAARVTKLPPPANEEA